MKNSKEDSKQSKSKFRTDKRHLRCLLVLSVRCRHFDNKQNEIKSKKENLQPSKRQMKKNYLIQLKKEIVSFVFVY